MNEKDDSKIAYEPSILSIEDDDKILSSASLPLIPNNEEKQEYQDKSPQKIKTKIDI